MNLAELLKQRPIVVVAGPNGAGKSMFYDAYLADIAVPFVNADLLALSLTMDAYGAAAMADKVRRDLVAAKQSFIFETVFSDPVGDKINFLKMAEAAGYSVLLIFIGIASSRVSGQRVTLGFANGGHDVPGQELAERFPRTLNNLSRALRELPNVLVYDHSDLQQGYRLVASVERRQAITLHEPVPDWLHPLLP